MLASILGEVKSDPLQRSETSSSLRKGEKNSQPTEIKEKKWKTIIFIKTRKNVDLYHTVFFNVNMEFFVPIFLFLHSLNSRSSHSSRTKSDSSHRNILVAGSIILVQYSSPNSLSNLSNRLNSLSNHKSTFNSLRCPGYLGNLSCILYLSFPGKYFFSLS